MSILFIHIIFATQLCISLNFCWIAVYYVDIASTKPTLLARALRTSLVTVYVHIL